ncbi:substrate binding domain-containing protein [Sorangium sp. So ce1504]|uniref:substrate binding domain-containing protein n=1 Tax=Sorangium sp. So ce1504 TaxID=3133337 RepID=UPI003F631B5C
MLARPGLEGDRSPPRHAFDGVGLHGAIARADALDELAADVDDADRAVTQMQDGPRGLLRITAPLHFGWIGGVVAEHLRGHPEASVEVVCTDRIVDLVAEGFDAALRLGAPSDTSLVARRLGALPRYLVAAPAYIASRGAPRAPSDLAGHDVLVSTGARAVGPPGARWVLHRGARRAEVRATPRATANDLEVLHRIVLAGVGIGMLPREGRLSRVLDGWSPADVPLHAVYPGTRHLSPKVKVFLDLVRERMSPALRDRGREIRANEAQMDDGSPESHKRAQNGRRPGA